LLSAVVLSVIPTIGGADDIPKPALPSDSVWVMNYDDKLDGELKPKPGSEVRWRIAVRNERIFANLADKKQNDPDDHRISGEVVTGKPHIVSLRQDGPGGLVAFYTGRLVANNKMIGTWYDNRGGSGDFEMTVEKKD
jgi:hypothetical protein